MIPRAVGLGSFQINLLVFTAIASTLGAGSVAIYNFADNIQTMPTAVFGLSFITALFPTLSQKYTQKKHTEFAELLWRGIRYILVILIPAGIGLILLRTEIIRLILGSSLFNWQATVDTANTLGFFAISLFTFAIASLLAKAFYATQDTLTPTIYNIISYLISMALGYHFAVNLGLHVPGLALGFSIANYFYCLTLYLILRKRVKEIKNGEKEIWSILKKLILGTLVLVASVQLTKIGAGIILGDLDTWIKVATKTGLAIMTGAFSYIATMLALNVPEINFALNIIRAKFWPNKIERQNINAGFEDLAN